MLKRLLAAFALLVIAADRAEAQIDQFTFYGCGDFACVTEVVTSTKLVTPYLNAGITFDRAYQRRTTFDFFGAGALVHSSGTFSAINPLLDIDPGFYDIGAFSGTGSLGLACYSNPCFGTKIDVGISWYIPVGFDVSTSQLGVTLYDPREATFVTDQWGNTYTNESYYGPRRFVAVTLVPEPSTYAMMACGLFAIAFGHQRSRRRALTSQLQ